MKNRSYWGGNRIREVRIWEVPLYLSLLQISSDLNAFPCGIREGPTDHKTKDEIKIEQLEPEL